MVTLRSMAALLDGHGRPVDIYAEDGFRLLTELWLKAAVQHRVMYRPTWLGVPIIQFAEDLLMMQELIWRLRPDVIVETGIAHGGSAIFHASMLELMGKGRVIAVDIEIRPQNRLAIERHPMASRVELLEGSSVDPQTVAEVRRRIRPSDRVLVILDSNHTRDHVTSEMEAYGPLVEPGSYMVVMDGAQAFMGDIPRGRPEWAQDNPLSALRAFVERNRGWEIDDHYTRLEITSNPSGFLRRLAEP